jgi:hypothetical protein
MKIFYSAIVMASLLGVIPAQVQAANDEASGSGTVTDVIISDNVLWTTLRSVTHTVNGGAGTNDCMVVAGADVSNPGQSAEKHYLFTITRNNNGNGVPALAENGTAERTLGFVDNSGVDDINTQPVSTNAVFTGLTSTNGTSGTNQHTFYFLGKKKTSTSPSANARVEDSRIDFVCVDRD